MVWTSAAAVSLCAPPVDQREYSWLTPDGDEPPPHRPIVRWPWSARKSTDDAPVPAADPAASGQTRQTLFQQARRTEVLSRGRLPPAIPNASSPPVPPDPPEIERTSATGRDQRRGSIDLTAFDGHSNRQPADPQPAETPSATRARTATHALTEAPAASPPPMAELPLPPLDLEPPFTDSLPPIVQMSHAAETPPPRQIARPLFNELLEESAEPAPIIQTDWEVPGWQAAEAGWHNVRQWASPSDEDCEECWDNPWKRLFCLGLHKTSPDIGIGQERVALGGFEIDASQPFNNVRVRYDAVYGLPFPDRSLYFWAKSGNGPPSAGEVVNYQDMRVYSEIGNKSASAIVEYTLRSLDPEINSNTTGYGDMVVGNKAVIVDGRYWQITQVFRTYVNTGSVKKGLGTGHVSLEPGVLARYKWTDDTYLHGEVKFWFPVGADPNFGGQILRTGIGLTTLGYETDTFALIHSAELVIYNFVGGRKTVFPIGDTSVDGEISGTLLYGPRLVLGPAGDLGLFELGVNGGLGIGDSWIDGLFRLELRWSY